MRYFFYLFIALLVGSCAKKNEVEEAIDTMDLSIEWNRFDKDFVETPENDFNTLRTKYSFLLPANVEDSVWFNKRNDSLFQVVTQEVQSKYPDLSLVEEPVNSVLKHIHYYFPDEYPKRVVTLVSDVDVNSRAIYADSLLLLSLDTYLGKDHRFYKVFPEYTLRDFETNRLPIDVAYSFALQKIPMTTDRTLLGQMIYFGKILALVDYLVPDASQELKLNYTKEEMQWAKENEVEIWKFLVDKKYLYDTNPKLFQRFIQKAPFSKFYLAFDNESPGSIGVFIGNEIVQSYLKNNNVTLHELLIKDEKEIFDNAKYKPKK